MNRKPDHYAPHVYYRNGVDYGVKEAVAVSIEDANPVAMAIKTAAMLVRLMEQLEYHAAIPPTDLCKVLGPEWNLTK